MSYKLIPRLGPSDLCLACRDLGPVSYHESCNLIGPNSLRTWCILMLSWLISETDIGAN